MDEAIKICEFQQRLVELRQEIEAAGFKITVFWTGEYGGTESVALGSTDGMNVVKLNEMQ